MSARKRSRTSMRGAAMVEFMIALMPMAGMFFGFTQLAWLGNASLVTKHATLAATRAAVVILDHEHNPGDNGSEQDIQTALTLAMGPYATEGGLVDAKADCQKADKSDPFGLVTCNVTVTYNCSVPLGGLLVCGGRTKQLTEKMSLPHQGARYK